MPSIKDLAELGHDIAHEYYVKGVLDGFDKHAELMQDALNAGATAEEALARALGAREAIADLRAMQGESTR